MVNQHTVKRPVLHCECGNHAWVSLTRGYTALISPEDADFVGRWSWTTLARKDRKHRKLRPCAVRRENNPAKFFYMHREILGAGPGLYVDHRNADELDNRRSNIRLCSAGQNAASQRPHVKKRSSPFKGVYHDKARGNFQAYISFNGKRHRLGRFANEEDAARAYDAKARELHGEYALTNEALGLFP